MKDYQKTIQLNKTAAAVYSALTAHIADWWSNDISGASTHTNDSFTIAFGNTKKTFTVIEAIPGERIVWKCEKAYISMASLKNKAEWEGTKIYWNIDTTEDGSRLSFLHEGLNERMECYEICEAGWEQFLASFESYVNTGNGNPYRKIPDKNEAAR